MQNLKYGSIETDPKTEVKSQIDSQNQSDKTKDTLQQTNSDSFLKCLLAVEFKMGEFLRDVVMKLINICNGTSTSDKVVRLTSSVIKFVKNFQLISKLSKFDKLTGQITQLRRILRINRLLMVIKDSVAIFKKEKKSKRDIFQIFFKAVMFLCDINDMLLYLMQLKVLRQRGILTLKKNVSNLYFFQCTLWVIQHFYDYLMKENQNDAEKKIRKVNIIKYLMDALVAHNDFSGKQFSLQVKNSCLLTLFSSFIGIWLIWK